jgi:hypothetical protein
VPKLPSDGVYALCEQNVNAGARLDAGTLTPEWDGTPLNLGWAIDVTHPRAIGH